MPTITLKRVAASAFVLACAVCRASEPDEFNIPPAATEKFARTLQTAIEHKDVQRVSELVQFPLRVNGSAGKFQRIGKDRFIQEYERIFTPAVVQQVLSQDPKALFENYQGVMFGDGAVWAAEYCSKHQKRPDCPVRVFVVNLP